MKSITKTALLGLLAAAIVAVPSVTRAQDSTNMPAASAPAKKKGNPPVHGKVSAVDAAAMTLTVGETTIAVTSETKIMKDGKPATLSDITVGENVVASGKKDASGKFNATKINVGEKAPKKKKADNAN